MAVPYVGLPVPWVVPHFSHSLGLGVPELLLGQGRPDLLALCVDPVLVLEPHWVSLQEGGCHELLAAQPLGDDGEPLQGHSPQPLSDVSERELLPLLAGEALDLGGQLRGVGGVRQGPQGVHLHGLAFDEPVPALNLPGAFQVQPPQLVGGCCHQVKPHVRIQLEAALGLLRLPHHLGDGALGLIHLPDHRRIHLVQGLQDIGGLGELRVVVGVGVQVELGLVLGLPALQPLLVGGLVPGVRLDLPLAQPFLHIRVDVRAAYHPWVWPKAEHLCQRLRSRLKLGDPLVHLFELSPCCSVWVHLRGFPDLLPHRRVGLSEGGGLLGGSGRHGRTGPVGAVPVVHLHPSLDKAPTGVQLLFLCPAVPEAPHGPGEQPGGHTNRRACTGPHRHVAAEGGQGRIHHVELARLAAQSAGEVHPRDHVQQVHRTAPGVVVQELAGCLVGPQRQATLHCLAQLGGGGQRPGGAKDGDPCQAQVQVQGRRPAHHVEVPLPPALLTGGRLPRQPVHHVHVLIEHPAERTL